MKNIVELTKKIKFNELNNYIKTFIKVDLDTSDEYVYSIWSNSKDLTLKKSKGSYILTSYFLYVGKFNGSFYFVRVYFKGLDINLKQKGITLVKDFNFIKYNKKEFSITKDVDCLKFQNFLLLYNNKETIEDYSKVEML